MSGFINQMFSVLLLMLYFAGSLAIQFVSKNNQQCMIRPTLVDLNLHEFHYYPFISSINTCNGSFNTPQDLFGRIYVPNNVSDMNLKVFHLIKTINDSKSLTKHISCECRCEFDSRKCNLKQKWNNDKC